MDMILRLRFLKIKPVRWRSKQPFKRDTQTDESRREECVYVQGWGRIGGRKRLTKEFTCLYAQPLDTGSSAVNSGEREGERGRGGVNREKKGTSVILATRKRSLTKEVIFYNGQNKQKVNCKKKGLHFLEGLSRHLVHSRG